MTYHAQCDCFYCQYQIMPPQIDYYEKKPKGKGQPMAHDCTTFAREIKHD